MIESLPGLILGLDWSLVGCIQLLAVGIILVFVASSLNQYIRLRNFDGPFLAKFSRLWLLQSVRSGKAYLHFWNVTQKYGPIARIGPNDLITSDPDLVKHMYSVRSEYCRSSWYRGMRFDPSKDNLLSLRNEADHKDLRAKMAAGYSGREVHGLEAIIDQNIIRFTELLGKYADKGAVVDFSKKTQYFTLDVISDIAFGTPFGFVQTDSDVYKYIETTEKTLPMVMVTTVIPFLVTMFASPLFKPALPSEKDVLGFGKVMSIAKHVAAERYGPQKKVQKDMLGSFVAHGLTNRQAESEILLQIVAGSDTTATAIRSTLLHIITTPRVLEKLRQEIATTEIKTPVISDADARQMPFLQAVIKEGLRIFPPVAGLMAKQAPSEGDHWKGVFIPGGTRIGSCAWGIFRREDIWGEDSKEFRPERWLESTPESLRRMEDALDLIFSHGRWQCLGRPIALVELNKIFVQLLRQFEFSVCDPTNPWTIYNCGIFSQSDFRVRVERREF
ncbi:hypothetical protein QQS21_002172 [Conoideocrella luteorostrata]|uniref:Pisatin demethylase n=1 Tax=Conoideocrella luteorostrata TaxID=1105319 RepID=A0AAJ0CYM4_9HYPO|nr:hypothetical protein QQS21_002172 [Conoideocrella luteorostrata]